MTGRSIFKPSVPEGFEWILPVDEVDFEVVQSLDGMSRRSGWRPIPVRILRFGDDGRPLRAADLPWFGEHVLVLSGRAIIVLGEVLSKFGELLPLTCAEGEFWLFNVLEVVDALDVERSDVMRFSSGRFMKIRRHEFDPEKLERVGVFKIPQMLRGSLYLTEDIVSDFRASGFEGTDFSRVWPPCDALR